MQCLEPKKVSKKVPIVKKTTVQSPSMYYYSMLVGMGESHVVQ